MTALPWPAGLMFPWQAIVHFGVGLQQADRQVAAPHGLTTVPSRRRDPCRLARQVKQFCG